MPAWAEIDRRGHPVAQALPRRPASCSTVTGPLGWTCIVGRPGPRRRHRGAGRRRSRPPSARRWPWSSCARPSSSAWPTLDDAERGRGRPRPRRGGRRRPGWPRWPRTSTVFHGFAAGGPDRARRGHAACADRRSPTTTTTTPRSAALAVAVLRAAGVDGPYAIALGPRCYTGVIESTEHGGYPVLRPPEDDPGRPGGVGPGGRRRGGAQPARWRLRAGRSARTSPSGYRGTDATSARLYLEESLAVRINSPEAAIRLAYP